MIWKYYLDSLFSGKQKGHNRDVLKQLLLRGEMTHFQLARHVFGGSYSSAHDRVVRLSELGVLIKKGERPGGGNKRPTTVWGLSPLGLWVAAHREDMPEARGMCGKHISEYWNAFTEIYHLDKVRGQKPAYDGFTKWLLSDKGLVNFLDNFGPRPLEGEIAALSAFFHMMELSLMVRRLTWIGPSGGYGYQWNIPLLYEGKYQKLGELAAKHEKFSKLESTLDDVNRPFENYLMHQAREKFIDRLSPVLGHSVAEKLSRISLFEEGKLQVPDWYAASLALGFLDEDSFEKNGTQLVIGTRTVTVKTRESSRIASEWREYCNSEVISTTRIPAKRRQDQ